MRRFWLSAGTGLLAGAGLWLALQHQYNGEAQVRSRRLAARVTEDLTDDFNAARVGLIALATEFGDHGDITQEHFERDVQGLLALLPEVRQFT